MSEGHRRRGWPEQGARPTQALAGKGFGANILFSGSAARGSVHQLRSRPTRKGPGIRQPATGRGGSRFGDTARFFTTQDLVRNFRSCVWGGMTAPRLAGASGGRRW